MKIGIYGDSYTVSHGDFYRPTNWYNKLASLLSEIHGTTTINHYGLAGSSVYYTYRKFLDTHHENDLNIVLLTGPGRFPHTVELSVPGNSQVFTCKEQVQGCIEHLNDMLTEDDLVNLNNVISWFDASKEGHRYFVDMSDLMTDKIENTPNTIIYPCFSDSFTNKRFANHKLDKDMHYMHSLWFRQLELLDIEVDNFTAQETEHLCGHLVPEFNVFFANMLYKRIKTGKWDISGFLDVKINGSRNIYYNNYNHE